MASPPILLGIFSNNGNESSQKRMLARLWTWVPVLLCTLAVAVESTSHFGADRTSAPLQRATEALFGHSVRTHWALIHHFLRKTGHFLGYGAFFLACFRSFWIEIEGSVPRRATQLRAHGLAMAATFLVASADEFHQSFLPNRTGKFSDVLLDTCGGIVLGLVLFFAMQAAEARRQAKAQSACPIDAACAESAA